MKMSSPPFPLMLSSDAVTVTASSVLGKDVASVACAAKDGRVFGVFGYRLGQSLGSMTLKIPEWGVKADALTQVAVKAVSRRESFGRTCMAILYYSQIVRCGHSNL